MLPLTFPGDFLIIFVVVLSRSKVLRNVTALPTIVASKSEFIIFIVRLWTVAA